MHNKKININRQQHSTFTLITQIKKKNKKKTNKHKQKYNNSRKINKHCRHYQINFKKKKIP